MINRWLVAFLMLMTVSAFAQKKDMNTTVSKLLQQMTLEEKLGQLNLPSIGFDVTGPILSQGVEEKIRKGLVGGVFNTFTPSAVRKLQDLAVKETRLKIPLLFGYDVIHGHRTIFPINLGLAASWDMDLLQRTARVAAEEASADGLNWTFSPMVDIARDPRWGRVSEGAGEDPYLGSQIGKAMVQGYQGIDLSKNNTILACVKHFALYGASEAGRDYNTVDMSRVKMYNEYLPPYKAAVQAGAGSVMTSFNEIDGIPATANKWLLTDLLRKQYGFNGLIVTDYTAINEMIAHGMGDEKKVGELSLNAGVDMDMVGEVFLKHGAQLVKEGKVSMAQIDAAVRRILEAKFKLGLFEDPYRYISEERNKTEIMNAQQLALSKEAAIKSMVLLKNSNQVLPLNASKKIAFIGPLVKDQRNLIGSWSGAGDYKKAVSLWAALEQKGGGYLYAKGCNLLEDENLLKRLNAHDGQITRETATPEQLITEAVATAQQADVVVAVLGEAFGMSGEAASRSMIGLPENQLALLKALKATGKPVVLVLMNGRPLTVSWENENIDAILETWFGGTQAGAAIADVLFGAANPSGKLTMSWPRNVGQIPIYYNAKNTGRPLDENQKYTTKYLDVPNTPLYPFGYGLSYTTFTYGDLKLDKKSITAKDKIQVTVTVSNTGNYDGVETVQLYIRDLVGTITRPVKELKGFKKVELKKGESKEVSFTISVEDLKFYNSDLKFVAEPGAFKVFVGGNSQEVKEAGFELK
ncbi:beta-glucosidase BglX [Pseudobacter ginsenosidimutans]|uniref:Periplasmic beta-glucosidase n=1 Tax=Pseudobacter ginsenosidimutans TaxID=661488 RepID=A0A4V2F0X3_9BACT|nr:beta-glucosidase BglX [Pseudobacter ginsenosidimutans]QEC41582.1 beta-glucosidase BglX [Pseudobacter ginsenosidimutans]RZS71631.1 beta-glucosidase [Pseudobacter ginsenosidimutans]